MSSIISDLPVQLIGIPLTLAANAFLVAAEFSLIKIRFSHFDRELGESVEDDRKVEPLILSTDQTIRLIRLGFTVCLMLYTLFAIPFLTGLMKKLDLSTSGIGSIPIAFIAFVIALFIHFLVSDLIPRAYGLSYPLRSLKAGSPLIGALGAVLKPVSKLANGVTSLLWKAIFKKDAPNLDSLGLDAQLEMMQNKSPEMSTVAQVIFKNTLLIRELVVADVLLPRNQVKYFDLNLPLNENLDMAKKTGHTRFPLCYGDLDRCLGLVHIKDIFRYKGDLARLDLRRIKRNMIRIESEEPLESALTKFLSHRMHMALVIDEFRGTEGVLTLERILEQLVGEIRDEFDADEEVLIRPEQGTDEAVVSGLTPLHEVEANFNVDLYNEEVSTVGGLVTSELGRIPLVGESVKVQNLEIEVTGVDETRVIEVRIKPIPEGDGESETQSDE